MHLDLSNGRLYYRSLELTPPNFLTREWVSKLKRAFPKINEGYSDYQKWTFQWYSLEDLRILDHYEVSISLSFKANMDLKEHSKFQLLYINFTPKFLKNEVFVQKKMSYSDKLKAVKSKYLELLEKMTDNTLEIEKRNKITFNSWGNARLSREKEIFYRLSIYWEK